MTRAARPPAAWAAPAMASFSELVGAAVRAATHQVVEGSRRNAREALEARYDVSRHGAEVLAALTAGARRTPAPRRVPDGLVPEQHRSA